MDSGPERATARPAYALLAIALTALAWWFGTSLQPLWWAAWLAPLPVLVYALRTRARWAALATFAAYAVGGANQWHYLVEVVRLPVTVGVLAILTPALLMVPITLLFRALALRGHAMAAMWSLPLATTAVAYLSAQLSPHGTYGHIAYSQMDALPVIQIAALTGLWGVGFLVWLLPALLATTSAPGLKPRARIFSALAGLTVLTLALAYGAWRLYAEPAPTQTVRVGLLSIGQMKEAQADLSQPEGQRMLHRYLVEFDRLADAGTQWIVAPESALLLRSHAIPELSRFAQRRGVRVLIGAEDHSDARAKHNAALVYEPGRDTPASYYKRHLIPGYEDRYTPGEQRLMLDGEPRVGVAICKDLDFTTTGRAYGELGTQLLLVPAWDFDDDAWLHGRMAILRGVEGGFAMARSARGGSLTLSDDRGRVLVQASSVGDGTPSSLIGELPLRATHTGYTRWGDAFAWLCALATLALASVALFQRKRQD